MKLVILDRDGTINADSDEYIKSPDEWLPIPGSLEAIARLNQAGYRVTLATNQSGLARGLFDMATLNAIQVHRTRRSGNHRARKTRAGKAYRSCIVVSALKATSEAAARPSASDRGVGWL